MSTCENSDGYGECGAPGFRQCKCGTWLCVGCWCDAYERADEALEAE